MNARSRLPGQARAVDRVEQPARLLAGQDRCRSPARRLPGPLDCGGRVLPDHLVDDEPVAERSDGGQVLVDGRLRRPAATDVGRDVQRLDLPQCDVAFPAPPHELPDGRRVGPPGPGVGDPSREVLDERLGGVLAGVGDDLGQRQSRDGVPDAEVAGVLPDGRDDLRGRRRPRRVHPGAGRDVCGDPFDPVAHGRACASLTRVSKRS